MTPPIKSILSYLVILAKASDIHSKNMRAKGGPVTLLLLQDKTIVFGKGLEPAQLPIIAYSLEKGVLDMFIYVDSRRCNFQYKDVIGTFIKFKTVEQINNNRLFILYSVADKVTVFTTILFINMEFCLDKVLFNYSWPVLSPKGVAMVFFNNGYDVITSENNRLSFDIDGNQLGKPEFFPVNSKDFSISVISERTRTSSYFILDNTHKVVKLVKQDEKQVGLFHFPTLLYTNNVQILSNNEQSVYSACVFLTQKKKDVTCYQFDRLGNEGWLNAVALEFDELLDVRSLIGGGVMFSAFKSKDNQLFFVKMGKKLEDVTIWSYSGKQIIKRGKLMEYSEYDHTFVLAYETSQVNKGILQKLVVTQTYFLEN